MIRTTPFHERLTELNHEVLGFVLVGVPVRAAFFPCPQAPSTWLYGTRWALRHLAAVQVPDHRLRGPFDFLSGVVVRDLSVLRRGPRGAYAVVG